MLDCRPSSDLDWKFSEGEKYFLDFGFEDANFSDEGKFNARLFAVEEFAKQLPNAKEVILAELEKPIGVEFAEVFSDYLHRLASALPEDTLPILVCNVEETEKLEDWILPLCKRRFEHFELRFPKKNIPISGREKTIVVLPQDEKYDPKFFGKIFGSLEAIPFKCIPEELLNEHWDGVDCLVVDQGSLGEMGRRMLLGFEAAGGEILWANKKGQVKHPAL